MDEWTRRTLLTISLVMVTLSVVFFPVFQQLIERNFVQKKNVLVIGILSSPVNIQRRITIRNTWLHLTDELPVSYYFIIGNKFCSIHPLDRINSYSCKGKNITLPENANVTKFVTAKKAPVKKFSISPRFRSVGFGFHTLLDIKIKEVGVLTSFMKLYKKNVTVKVVSSDSKAVLASVNITYKGSTDNPGFILAPVNDVSLKRDSETQVFMELTHDNPSHKAICEDFEWEYTPGVINHLQLFRAGFKKPWPFHPSSCSFLLMMYEIPDFGGSKEDKEEKTQRQIDWKRYVRNLGHQLKNEAAHFGDIVFVNVLDAYQNLPRKVVEFFKRMMDKEKFDFLLKTDDDTFIDVLRVYKKLSGVVYEGVVPEGDSAGGEPYFWWWSHFRESWKVQESGKWREDKYRSPAYPSFPCGAGYVLNRGLVSYLSENRKNFQYFQGEDVSVGIWLSGLKTVQCINPRIPEWNSDHIQENVVAKYKGKRAWLQLTDSDQFKRVGDVCEWTCDRESHNDIPSCNRIQLGVTEMYAVWNDYIRHGFIR